jgi:hypothetical protein
VGLLVDCCLFTLHAAAAIITVAVAVLAAITIPATPATIITIVVVTATVFNNIFYDENLTYLMGHMDRIGCLESIAHFR